MLSQEQFKTLRNKGLSVDQIVALDSGKSLTDGMARPKDTQQVSQVTPEKEPGYAERVYGQYQKAGEDITKQFEKQMQLEPGKDSAGEFIGESARTALRTAGGVAGAALAPITEAPIVKDVLDWVGTKFAGTDTAGKISYLIEKYPDAAKDIQNIIDVATLGTGKAAEKPVVSAIEKAAEKTVALGEKAAIATKEGIANTAAKTAAKASEKESAKILETIMPKVTSKEAKAALKEGRIVRGKAPTLFKAGEVDQVLPDIEMQRALKTIKERIPDASKMDDVDMMAALRKNVEDSSQMLKVNLEAVQVDDSVKKAIKDRWGSIKEAQKDTDMFLDKPGNAEFQNKFERRLLNVDNAKNLDELWDIAKEYDSSISNVVKEASDISDPQAQLLKSMWLQNRRLLRDTIEETAMKLDKSSVSPFKQMSDMYNAQESILSKAKVSNKAKSSKAVQFIKENKTPIAIGAGVVGVPTVVNRLIGN